MGNSNVAWKVNDGENRYFKPLSDSAWGEFVNGALVSNLNFFNRNGDQVTLRANDGSILEFDSQKVCKRQG
jgi:hypothetical protein